MSTPLFQTHHWAKHPNNPVLPNGGGWFDQNCCMNPFALRVGDEYYLYYAGADRDGHRRICLATAPVSDVSSWNRHGPLFDRGEPDSFDYNWCVLPCVHRINGKWHLYYTGNSGKPGLGLQGFYGMGLAVSDDLIHWKKHSSDYILSGDGFDEYPTNRAIAGAGRIIDLPQPDGRVLYRMYYTLPTGTPSKDLLVDQAKHAVIADSWDGITWFNKRFVLRPRLDADYENVAVIGLNVWKTRTRWRAIYAAIGTRFGAYSICEAVSDDGLMWHRGEPEQNLAIAPTRDDSWEGRMVEYPNVIEENGKLRLFYCGNGYGSTGIGTALAEPLD